MPALSLSTRMLFAKTGAKFERHDPITLIWVIWSPLTSQSTNAGINATNATNTNVSQFFNIATLVGVQDRYQNMNWLHTG